MLTVISGKLALVINNCLQITLANQNVADQVGNATYIVYINIVQDFIKC